MKKIRITTGALLLFIHLINAQDYTHALGVRGGLFNGFTYKQFLSRNDAIELLATSRWRGMNFTALYEKHEDIKNINSDLGNLRWYVGAGGHIGFYHGKYAWWGYYQPYTLIGVDGIIGLEFTLKEVPLNFSLDWKPTMHIIGLFGFWFDGGAFSVRYVF